MGRKRSESLEAEWRDRLRRHARSGLTVSGFCEREGVSSPSFYQWRRRLRGSERAKSKRVSERSGARESPFVPVRVSSAPVAEIQFPNGIQVRVPAGDMEALRMVLRAGSELVREQDPC